MKVPAYNDQQSQVQLDIEALLKWSDSVPGLTIADRMFHGRGVIPEQWCLVALLKDESKYVVGPNTGLTRPDLERIASFHWLRPDLVAKLPKWGGSPSAKAGGGIDGLQERLDRLEVASRREEPRVPAQQVYNNAHAQDFAMISTVLAVVAINVVNMMGYMPWLIQHRKEIVFVSGGLGAFCYVVHRINRGVFSFFCGFTLLLVAAMVVLDGFVSSLSGIGLFEMLTIFTRNL